MAFAQLTWRGSLRSVGASLSANATKLHLIGEESQQAHAVSYLAWKLVSPLQEVRHDDEPRAVSAWTLDARVP
jgi:hypothetical protein